MKSLFIILIMFPFILLGQMGIITTTPNSELKLDSISSIQTQDWKNLETASLEIKEQKAYQEKAQKKIENFYESLFLLSHLKADSIQQPLIMQIKSQFLEPTDSLKFINLNKPSNSSKDLDKIINEFKTVHKLNNLNVSNFNCINLSPKIIQCSYQLESNAADVLYKFNINQLVYIFRKEKQFGNTTKEVIEMKLGGFLMKEKPPKNTEG